MIHPHGRIKGSFPRDIIIVRNGGPLTAAYVLANSNSPPPGYIAGDILTGHASQITYWVDASFGTTPMTSLEIKAVFAPEPRGNVNVQAPHYGDNVFLGDLASTAASGWLVVTSASAPFFSWMVGRYLTIHSGTNFTPGRYLITAFTSTSSITIASAVGSVGDATLGIGGVTAEFQESAVTTAAGVTTLHPHSYSLVAANYPTIGADAKDGVRTCWTAPLPACDVMRLFVKGTGTVTGSSLILGVTLMPEGGL